MRRARRVQLRVVARLAVRPRAREVVAHEVDEVEVRGEGREREVAQTPFAGGEGGGEQVARGGERGAEGVEEVRVVCAVGEGGGVFPVD